MTLARLEISDGTTTISFYDPAATTGGAGFMVVQNGLTGVGSENFTFEEYASPLVEGAKVSRQVVSNRVVKAMCNLYGTSADDLFSRLRAVNTMCVEAARYSQTDGREGNLTTLTYQPHDSSYTNPARLLYGFAPTPDTISTAEAAPGLFVANVEITLVAEPYFVEANQWAIHNLIPELVQFGLLTSYASNVSPISLLASIVAGTLIGPFAVRCTPTATGQQLASPATPFSYTGALYAELWTKPVVGQTTPGYSISLQQFVASTWGTIATLTASTTVINGYTKYAVSFTTASTGPLRILINYTGAGQLDVCNPLVAVSAAGPIPAAGTVSPVSTTYSILSNNEDLTASPPRIGRYCMLLDTSSDGPALTAAQMVYQVNTGLVATVLTLGKRSRKTAWYNQEIFAAAPGVTPSGSSAFLDGAPGANVVNPPNDGVIKVGRSSGGVDLTAGVETGVMTWTPVSTINSLNPTHIPEGRFMAYILIADQASSTIIGNYNFWVAAYYQGTGTLQRITPIVSRPALSYAGSNSMVVVKLGEIDLTQRKPNGFGYPANYQLLVRAVNARGATGQYAWCGGLLLIPSDESIFQIGAGQSGYTGGQYSGMYYDASTNPPMGVGFASGGAMANVQPIIGDTLRLIPGDATLLTYQGVDINNVYVGNNMQHLVDIRVNRRWRGAR